MPEHTRLRHAVAVLAVASAAVPGPALASSADATSLRSEYATSLYGIVLARSTFKSRIDRNGFNISGELTSSGVAKIFDDTRARASANGRFEADTPSPRSYSVDYTAGKKKKKTTIAFADGSVSSAKNSPPVRTNRPDWIRVEKEHLAGVVDPISAALVRANTPADVCNRTIRVFDGALRVDLQLSPAGFGTASVPGYKGDTVKCVVRVMPVSGYRKGNKSIDFIRKSKDISIAFAPVGNSGVYAPVEATVGTQVGTVKVQAVRFESLK
ncbi:DUF3108 domain-containing protein [Aquibium carbonis]|uniref:DUF3108 domain-containing protein n=1 Tax=Aquibium carbonis TaxID=2495581 RepID=UPI0014796EDE|nr:DUF3108 domain-containing protein [Aquibium carbonis]